MDWKVWLGLGSLGALVVLASQASPPEASSKQGPYEIPAARHGVGTLVPDLRFRPMQGKEVTLQSLAQSSKVVVVALTSATCPLTKRYGPTLASIESEFSAKGVRFVYVNPSQVETESEVQAMIRSAGFKGPYVRKEATAIAQSLKAMTTTDVFVIDSRRTLRYRGAVDDQYGIGFNRPAPKQTYLRDAIEAVLKGQAPRIAATWAPGCVLELGAKKPTAQPEKVTYTEHISRLMQVNCVTCHRPGGVGPFRLDTYQDVKDRAAMIKFATDRGIMPPWFAADTPGHEDRWSNNRRLSEADKVMLQAWIDAEMPEGNRSLAPLPLSYSEEWDMGKPDAIFEVPQPLSVQATGFMEYIHVDVDPQLSEDKWVEAIEVLPTAQGVVHHILVFAVPRSQRGLGQDFGGLRGFFGAYVPGNHTLWYPKGFAKKLAKDTVFQFQIHYTPNGTAAVDRPRIALKYASNPPEHEVRTRGIFNISLRIPPRVNHHMQKAFLRVDEDMMLWSFMPHMHVRGKAFRYEVEYPDGKTELLLDVPRFDFNWQLKYDLSKPILIPKGSRMIATAWYDNSEANPSNPDPSKTVFFGDQTFDEMLIGYIDTSSPNR
ncbi:MAG TPA: redoxin family protein [Fimbriimonadaceae bacterium]|nr:redoxin family protein [Fimbriimonadaceae bacterium]HRJ32683.1 redoxin family protein [Fimbriimonadaceae bacterium]